MVPGVLTSDWFPLLLLVLSLNNCLAFFCSLKINTETCSRASSVTRLGSPPGLNQTFRQSMPGSFSRDCLPVCLQLGLKAEGDGMFRAV